MFLYALRLIENRFYIGKSQNVEKRFLRHKQGSGSEWTKKYPPITIEHVRPTFKFGELSLVLDYMDKHGIENVRGDIYSNVILSKSQMREIKIHLRHENKLCLFCGSNDHFMNSCFPKIEKTFDLLKEKQNDDYR